jgi:hypothetical protein
MSKSNVVFLGCNYNDKKIKAQFDSLKRRIEVDTPLTCIVLDKRSGKPARDLWQDIKDAIEQSAACIFDVTGFRPNVVLELGYALSIKSVNQVFITFRKRKSKGKAPAWLLSDISHLQRHEYVNVATLEKYVRGQLALIPFSSDLAKFMIECDSTNAADKYRECGLKVLQNVRDEGPRSRQQLQAVMSGSACRWSKMELLLRKNKLLSRNRGQHGKYLIPNLAD